MTIQDALAQHIKYIRQPTWVGGYIQLPEKLPGLNFYGPALIMLPSGRVKPVALHDIGWLDKNSNSWVEAEVTEP